MLRVDDQLRNAVQHGYDMCAERLELSVGTFRMALAVLPVGIDAGLELAVSPPVPVLWGVLAYTCAIRLLYGPRLMARHNRQQRRGLLRALNAEARRWTERTARLRLGYVGLTALSLLVLHHVGGLALVGLAYARCVQVRPPRIHHPRVRGAPSAPVLRHA